MSEIGDLFAVYHEVQRAKKISNRVSSLNILRDAGYKTQQFTCDHYRVGRFDFWPSTGKWRDMKSGEYGRGVFQLMLKLKDD